ncbi:MAG: NAD(P)-dependent oxidoreductase [Myxococcales bacterium]|nr:NAD(P)-dependent oxidoreductase [Myxococcales bacterium]
MNDKSRIAFLGLGAMGSRMALRLLDAGHAVVVYNRSPGPLDALVMRGAQRASTPGAAATGCEIVVACVRDDAAAREVWDGPDGALAAMSRDSIAVESSTLTPTCVRELGAVATQRGVHFLDAPVVGSTPQAEAGQLVFLVGGAPEVIGRARPVFEAIGGAFHHVGELGQGAVMKLVVNALFGIQVVAMSELLSLAARSGVDKRTALEVLGGLPTTSASAKGAGALIVSSDHAPRFPVELVEKDLGYATQLGAKNSAETPMTGRAREVFQGSLGRGDGALNLTAVARLFD